MTDEDRARADALAGAERDTWVGPWSGRLMFEYDNDARTLEVHGMQADGTQATHIPANFAHDYTEG